MRQVLAMCALALLAPAARADLISEEEFLATLGDTHMAGLSIQDGLARAEAARTRAATLANPRIEFWREAPDASPRVTNWTVAWVPPLDGRYGLGKEAAEKGLAAAHERHRLELAALRSEARGSFADWSFTSERIDFLRRQLEVVSQLAQQQHERARVGEESGLAARRFLLAADEVRAALRESEAESAAAEAVARAWRPDLPPNATPTPIVLPDPPVVSVEAGSPEIRALMLETEQAGLDERRAQRYWGFPTLQIGRQTINSGSVVHEGPIVAAGWSVPLFDRDQGARLEAQRRKEVTASRLEWAKARVRAEIEGGVAAYGVLFKSAQEAGNAARGTDRIIEAATASFRAGEASLTDLLETLRAALAARLREIDARAQALAAHRALETVVGEPLTAGGTR